MREWLWMTFERLQHRFESEKSSRLCGKLLENSQSDWFSSRCQSCTSFEACFELYSLLKKLFRFCNRSSNSTNSRNLWIISKSIFKSTYGQKRSLMDILKCPNHNDRFCRTREETMFCFKLLQPKRKQRSPPQIMLNISTFNPSSKCFSSQAFRTTWLGKIHLMNSGFLEGFQPQED